MEWCYKDSAHSSTPTLFQLQRCAGIIFQGDMGRIISVSGWIQTQFLWDSVPGMQFLALIGIENYSSGTVANASGRENCFSCRMWLGSFVWGAAIEPGPSSQTTHESMTHIHSHSQRPRYTRRDPWADLLPSSVFINVSAEGPVGYGGSHCICLDLIASIFFGGGSDWHWKNTVGEGDKKGSSSTVGLLNSAVTLELVQNQQDLWQASKPDTGFWMCYSWVPPVLTYSIPLLCLLLYPTSSPVCFPPPPSSLGSCKVVKHGASAVASPA